MPPALRHRGDDVAAVAEREDRQVDAEHVAEIGVHGWLPPVRTRSWGSGCGGERPAIVGLAARRAHHLVDDVQLTRHLVAGDRLTAVLLDRLEIGGEAGPRLDDCGDTLAPSLVGHADDDRVPDVGVRLHRRFDFLGMDLLAARVDRHRPAAEQGDRAVGLDRSEVAGDRPAPALQLDERRRRLLRVLVVTDRHVAAARDLADHPRAGLDPRAVVGEHGGVLGGLDRRPALHRRVVLRHHRQPVATALGRADRVGHDQVRQALEEVVLHGRREHRGRARQRDERRQVVVGPRVVERLDERPAHRVAGDHHDVDLLLADEAPHVVRIEGGDEHDLVADERSLHQTPLRRAVHQRCDRQHRHRAVGEATFDHAPWARDPVAGRQVEPAAEREEHVLLSPHDTLGHARRAAGVEDVVVVGRARPEVTLGSAAHHGRLVVDRTRGDGHVGAVVDRDDVTQVGQVGPHALDPRRSTGAGGRAPRGRRS